MLSIEVVVPKPPIVKAGVVGELVDEGSANLVGQLVGIGEIRFQRQAEEADLVWKWIPVGSVFDGRRAFVEAVEHLVVVRQGCLHLLVARLVLDDDGHVVEQAADFRRQAVDGLLDQGFEWLVKPRLSPPPL